MPTNEQIIAYVLSDALRNIIWYAANLSDDYDTECLVNYIIGNDNDMFDPDLEHANMAESRIKAILSELDNES